MFPVTLYLYFLLVCKRKVGSVSLICQQLQDLIIFSSRAVKFGVVTTLGIYRVFREVCSGGGVCVTDMLTLWDLNIFQPRVVQFGLVVSLVSILPAG